MSDDLGQDRGESSRWTRILALSTAPLCFYYLTIFLPYRTVLGYHLTFKHVPFAVVAVMVVTHRILGWLHRRRWLSERHMKGFTVASMSLLLCAAAADIAAAIYFMSSASTRSFDEQRETDRQAWSGEVMPRGYYPTSRNFQIFKPDVQVVANLYGGRYYPGLMKSPTVARSVLELRSIAISIDKNGFRETTPLEQAHVFALGDSFTFGSGTTQERIWPERLERAIHQPVYNLGIPSSGPKQELMLLEYMLETKSDAMKVQNLVWMIFEGNDLQESYDTLNPYESQPRLVERLRAAAEAVRENSVLHRLFEPADTYSIDGMDIAFPVYHSDKFGYRLSNPTYGGRSSATRDEVLTNSNRALLDQTFAEMANLSHERGFDVTVVIAPSDISLYWPYFPDLSRISEEPYFIGYVESLSKGLGFRVVNLWQEMQPYAKEEMLFWRDDVHWNDRGNEVVADIVARELAKPPTATAVPTVRK